MTARGYLRCTFDLPVGTKHRLENFKLELRRRGLGPVSEALIVEALIEQAEIAPLEIHLRERPLRFRSAGNQPHETENAISPGVVRLGTRSKGT